MKVVFLLLGIIAGAVVAFFLNKFLTDKLESKKQRIGLSITAYIICILLGIGFVSVISLRATLDKFIDGRINVLENRLISIFPNTNIMEKSMDTTEFVSIIDQLQQSTKEIDTSKDSFFESMIYDAFFSRLNNYADTIQSGVNAVTMGSDDGLITIKSTMVNIKHLALDKIEPYFKFIQIAIIVLLLIFIGVFAGVVTFLKKGGGAYNKSMVFGDNIE